MEVESKGNTINMRDLRPELEQWVLCGRLEFELEQQPGELEQQHFVSGGLQYLKSRTWE